MFKIKYLLFFLMISTALAESIVVVTHKNNRRVISKDDIEFNYSGNDFDFPVSDNQVLEKLFYQKLLEKEIVDIYKMWGQLVFSGTGTRPQRLSNDREVIEWIINNPRGIGYIKQTSYIEDPLKQILRLE